MDITESWSNASLFPSVTDSVTSVKPGNSSNPRSNRNAALFEAALRTQLIESESMDIETGHAYAETSYEKEAEEDLYKYKHAPGGPAVIATALIRPQSGIVDWINAFTKFMSLQSDMTIVVQMLRCTAEEGKEVIAAQLSSELHVVMPPQVEPRKPMTMEDRAKCTPSQIGYLRVTLDLKTIEQLCVSPDCLIPCMFMDPSVPVVGLGPAVRLEGRKFLSQLSHTIEFAAKNGAAECHLIFDHKQVIFGCRYKSRVEKAMFMDERTGTYVSAPPVENMRVTYLPYVGSTSDGGDAIYNNTSFVIPVGDELGGDHAEWYSVPWEKEDLKKILSGLKSSSRDGDKGGQLFKSSSTGEGSSSTNGVTCKLGITHTFVPPKDFRVGWVAPDSLGPMASSYRDEKSLWWGFVDTISVKVNIDSSPDIISEQVVYVPMGPNSEECFKNASYYAVKQYLDNMAATAVNGKTSAAQDFEALVAKHWPSSSDLAERQSASQIINRLQASGAYYIPQIRISLNHLSLFLHAAEAKNCRFVTKHSRSNAHKDDTAILLYYCFGNEMPGGNDSGTSSKSDQSSKFQRNGASATAVSQYTMRPVTMTILTTVQRVRDELDADGKATAPMDAAKFAPNGVEWRKLMPNVAWCFDRDQFMIVDGTAAATGSTNQMWDSVDFNNIDLDEYN